VRAERAQATLSSDPANAVSRFTVTNVDDESWVQLWGATSHREPQSHPAYAKALLPAVGDLRCARYSDPGGSILMPFILRPVGSEGAQSTLDATTPYGYGGAYLDGSPDASAFWDAWDDWARRHHVVGLTTRRHLFPEGIAIRDEWEFSPLRNVVVPTGEDPEVLWRSFEGRVRTDVRKGGALGVKVVLDEDCRELETFHRLYIQTMDRLGADKYYHFSLERLDALCTALSGDIALAHAVLDGRVIASEMQLLGEENAYYFLSGSAAEARGVPFGAAVKWQVIQWLHERGIRRYVLGGGIRPDDSLFRYKRAFAPKSLVNFIVGHHTVMSEEVDRLVESRRVADPGWEPAPDFAPAYRAPGRVMESAAP
jgi:hypothetical protein